MTPQDPGEPQGLSLGVRSLAVLILGAASCLSVIPSDAESLILDEERACTGTPPEGEDSECIGIQAGDCPCSSEGTLTAVNIAFLDDIEARRLADSSGGLCRDQLSDSETCCATGSACVDGRCELVGPRGRTFAEDCGEALLVDGDGEPPPPPPPPP